MIAVNVLIGKLNSIFFSDEYLVRRAMGEWFGGAKTQCPYCDARARCKPLGKYRRMMITIENGERKEVELEVPRVRCESCHRTHAILPDALIPYGSYSLRFILCVMNEFLRRTVNVVSFCERWAISSSTLYDWFHLFQNQYDLWVTVVTRFAELNAEQFLSALSVVFGTPEFVSDFRGRFGVSFLQMTTPSFPKGRKSLESKELHIIPK